MTTNASAGLVTALKSSLADTNDGWTVLSVSEVQGQTSYVVDTERIFVTRDYMTVTLTAAALTLDTGSQMPMVLTYVSVYESEVYLSGSIMAHGGSWATSDSALDATVRALAAAFLSARDTRLTAALNAAASTVDIVPSDVLTAIKTSLADAGAEWEVRHVTKTPMMLPGGTAEALEVSVTCVSGVARVPAGSSLPAQFMYAGRLNAKGDLIEARLYVSGATWRTKDAALHSTVMTMAATFLTEQQAAIVAGLEA